MRSLSKYLALCTLVAAVLSCSKDDEPELKMSFSGPSEITFSQKGSSASVTFRTNYAWSFEIPSGAESWLTVSPKSADKTAEVKFYKISLRAAENTADSPREVELRLVYGSDSKSIHLYQPSLSSLPGVDATSITDDMFFSSSPAATSTAVQQGFEFTADMNTMYFSQLNSNYKNIISRTKRVPITSSTALASEKMQLYFFSHGNNIHLEEASDGNAYIWLANYGTRDSDGKYNSPQILSRVKFVPGTTVRNTETTDNYWFGTKTIHASFDVANDQLAILGDSYTVKVYRLSEVLAAPVKNINLLYELTCGGAKSPDPEYKGKPVVKAHDCTGLTPIAKFTYDYKANGRGWQTFCIHDNKAYYFLFYKDKTNDMYYQSVIDILDFKGVRVKFDIKQPFSDNIDDLVHYGLTDTATRYMENEGILIRDNVLYLLYTAKNQAGFRRPVIFQLSASSLI